MDRDYIALSVEDSVVYALRCVICDQRCVRVFEGNSLCEECFKKAKESTPTPSDKSGGKNG